MSQSHLPPEEPRLSSEAPPQEGPAASQNPAPPAEDTAAQKAGKEKKPGAFRYLVSRFPGKIREHHRTKEYITIK